MTWGPSIAGAAVRRRIVPYLVLALAAILMLLALTPYGAATSPDSIRYLDVAQNIRAGRGIVSTDAGVDPPYRSFTTYPPLYPLTLASALSPDVPDLEMAARLAIVLLVLSALLVFEILRPAIGRDGALTGALLFLIAQPPNARSRRPGGLRRPPTASASMSRSGRLHRRRCTKGLRCRHAAPTSTSTATSRAFLTMAAY